jgi:hypothetical protein
MTVTRLSAYPGRDSGPVFNRHGAKGRHGRQDF